MIKLIYPNLEIQEKALAFKKEFYDANEHTIYGSYKLDVDKYSYCQWLEIIEKNKKIETADPRFGISDTLFVINEKDEIVGIVNIRYESKEFYKDKGHIGYSVAPSKRRRGYASQILKEALLLCKEHGLVEIKLVCDKENIASKNTILRNGGQFHRTIEDENNIEEEYIIYI